MATTKTSKPANITSYSTDVARSVSNGVIGGLVGGVVFGMMMSMLGMIGMVAMLVGSESVVIGWVAHLAISIFIGATFGLLAKNQLANWGAGIGLGVAYGVFWWILGALVLMPAKLGMPIFVVNTMAWQSLMGHMVFGLVLGVVAVALTRRSQHV